MHSFRDPITNVLKGYGVCSSNAPGDLIQAELDTFNLDPKQGWQLVNSTWVPYTIPPKIPQTVTPLQARRALLAAGLFSQVTALIALAPVETQQAWEYASFFARDDAILLQLTIQMGLTSAQIDALFLSAASFT